MGMKTANIPKRHALARRFTCEFGNSHIMLDTCECHRHYGMMPFEFRMERNRLFPYLRTSAMLTEVQKKEIMENYLSSKK